MGLSEKIMDYNPLQTGISMVVSFIAPLKKTQPYEDSVVVLELFYSRIQRAKDFPAMIGRSLIVTIVITGAITSQSDPSPDSLRANSQP